jgi:hypothetical protein
MELHALLLKQTSMHEKACVKTRDYFTWMPNDDLDDFMKGVPLTSDRAAPLVRTLLHNIGCKASEVNSLSIHRAKRTMLELGVLRGESTMAINLQGHWSTPNTRMATVYSQRNILIPIEMIHRIVGDLRKGWIPSADAWKDPGPMGDTEGDIPTSIDAADIEVIPLDAREEVQVTLLNNSVEEFLAKSEVHLDGTTTPTPSVTTAGTGDEFSESDASELAEDIAELVDTEDDVVIVYQKKSSEFGMNKLHAPQVGTQRISSDIQ